ncbi:MAG TPA: hypothetical protein PLV42_07475 [bacterium]|nr:hypothetical protein [bacterium]
MSTLRIASLLIIGIAFLLAACDDSSTTYYLKLPVEVRTVQKPVRCVDGSVGYVAFVSDNTLDGGKLKMIDGCRGVVNADFTDDSPGAGKGLLAGPVVAGFDLMALDDGFLAAIAVPEERRLSFKRLDDALQYLPQDTETVALEMMPRSVNVLSDLFLVLGDTFILEAAALVDRQGKVYDQDPVRRYADLACDGARCVALEEGTGAAYLLTVSGNGAEPLLVSEPIDLSGLSAISFGGVASLGEDRFVIWNEVTAMVLAGTEDLELTAEITLPYDVWVTAVAAVPYIGARLYSLLDDHEFAVKVPVYIDQNDDDALLAGDDELSTDNEEDLLTDEGSVPDDDALLVRSAALAADTDDDALVLPAGSYDSRNADAVWFATDSGRIFSYDLLLHGWMLDPLEGDDTGVPQISFAGVTIPENTDTTEANMPRIKRISAVQGLPFVVSYDLIYEALFEGSRSDGGAWDADLSRFSDKRADFTKIITGDPNAYAVLLTGARGGQKCLIPARSGVSLPVVRVVDRWTLEVDPGLWREELADCYDGPISYGVFPRQRYLVRVTLPGGTVVQRIAREMPAEWTPLVSRETSYSDEYIDIILQRRTDDVVTAQGLVFSFTVSPSRAFLGPDSADIFERILPISNGHVLLFSPLRSRLFEYSPVFEKTIVTYR